ncbi:MAG: hypothetical protein ACLTBV_34425 [Enterocloster bolteae]
MEWETYKQLRYDNPVLVDEKRGESILTEPAAIKRQWTLRICMAA